MTEKKENCLVCDDCGIKDPSVEHVADPYMEEVWHQINMKNLCPKCYRKSLDEV